MFNADEMLRTTPGRALTNERALSECIEACFECAQACIGCADACLEEPGVAELRRCVRLNLGCADLCEATGRLLSRQFAPTDELVRKQIELLALTAAACAAECDRHGDKHAHCRVCRDVCRRCEAACHALLTTIAQETARH